MNLVEILNNIDVIHVSGSAEDKEIDAVELDSRNIREKSLFVAIKGYKVDGHDFIMQAISNGASAIVLENDSAIPNEMFLVNDTVKILVEDSRKALSQISSAFYEHPSRKLKLIGVTGTKGKTTTTYYIKNIIETAGKKCGLIGTNKYIVDNKEYKASHTTPEANVINRLLTEMISAGCEYAVMEISSHSISLKRVDDLDIDTMIFTNITSDHLDYHKTFESYRDAKAEIFVKLKTEATAILNADDPNSEYIAAKTKANKIYFGTDPNSDYYMTGINYSLDGTHWKLLCRGKEYKMTTSLIGKFNAYNAVAALSAAVESGIYIEEAIEGVKSMEQVPGRFEVLSKGNKKVIIDYSHTADSLEQALISIRHLAGEKKKVVTVFGCGGDRDKTKRPIMGSIAEKYSDEIIVTSDNPRTEDPMNIIDEIIKGMTKGNYKVIEKREDAIKEAIFNSDENAVVLIAGKGHESYQEINGVRHHFSDKETAQKYLERLD